MCSFGIWLFTICNCRIFIEHSEPRKLSKLSNTNGALYTLREPWETIRNTSAYPLMARIAAAGPVEGWEGPAGMAGEILSLKSYEETLLKISWKYLIGPSGKLEILSESMESHRKWWNLSKSSKSSKNVYKTNVSLKVNISRKAVKPFIKALFQAKSSKVVKS